MTERSVTHATFVVERSYPASPERVFAAFATLEAKSRWFGAPADTLAEDPMFEFRVGGRERFVAKQPGATFIYDAVYYDIVPGQRIVSASEMYADGARISVSLETTELTPEREGTKLTYTEHGVYLDGLDQPEYREQGYSAQLDKLGEILRAESR